MSTKRSSKKAASKKLTAAQVKSISENKAVQAYGVGCSMGHHSAMQWMGDRGRMNPYSSTALQHVVLGYVKAATKARGIAKERVRGQIVGFFSTLENPPLGAELERWRQNRERTEKQGKQS